MKPGYQVPGRGSSRPQKAAALLDHSVMSNSCDPMDYSPPGSSIHGSG